MNLHPREFSEMDWLVASFPSDVVSNFELISFDITYLNLCYIPVLCLLCIYNQHVYLGFAAYSTNNT